MDVGKYEQLIRPLMSAYRFRHSQCVCRAALDLAQRWGADPDRAQLAGILHDVVKDFPHEKQLALLRGYGIRLTPLELAAPKLWHAILGAAYLQRELGIADAEVLAAVRYHTTGRAQMCLLEQVIFTADFISADRTYTGVEVLRHSARQGGPLDVMLEGLAFTIGDLSAQRVAIHPDTVAAYNEITLALRDRQIKIGQAKG